MKLSTFILKNVAIKTFLSMFLLFIVMSIDENEGKSIGLIILLYPVVMLILAAIDNLILILLASIKNPSIIFYFFIEQLITANFAILMLGFYFKINPLNLYVIISYNTTAIIYTLTGWKTWKDKFINGEYQQ